MPFYELLLLAIALAMDAFAVAVASGVCLCLVNTRQTLRMACAFGLFQFGMPIAGWFAGFFLYSFVKGYAHWIALAALSAIGCKMIIDGLRNSNTCGTTDPTQGYVLLGLAFATSVDAFIVGASFSLLDIVVWFPACVIGLVAFLVTICGLHLGCRVSKVASRAQYASIFGGVLLIGIGVHIVLRHL